MRTSRAALLAAAMLAAGPAAADPRDDVLQALAKCIGIADHDARAACYDAQAPALRAVTQPPAPAGAATGPAMPPPPDVAAAPAPQAPSGSQSTTILSSLNPFSDSGSSPDTDRPSAAQMAYQAPGQEILPITIAATQVEVQPGDGFTVTLANGQVWTEHRGHHEIPRFKQDGTDIVTIERGMIGGYDMYVRGSTGQYKVDRIK